MTQCEKCLNYEPAAWHKSDVVFVGDAQKDAASAEQHCLPFGGKDGTIPAKYWDGTEKCPYYMNK